MVAQTVVKSSPAQKIKKEPAAPAVKVTEILKRAAIAGKISKEELESVSSLAQALKTFMGA